MAQINTFLRENSYGPVLYILPSKLTEKFGRYLKNNKPLKQYVLAEREQKV